MSVFKSKLHFTLAFTGALLLLSMHVQAVDSHVLEEGFREFIRQQEREQDIRSNYEQRPDVRLDREQPQARELGTDDLCFTISQLVLVGDESNPLPIC